MSTNNDNISFNEAQGISTTDSEPIEKRTSMGDCKITAEEALLERKLNLTWKHGSMFRPSSLWPTSSTSENHSQPTCHCLKPGFEDYPLTTALSFQSCVSQFCPVDPLDPGNLATFPVASHKGFLCIQGFFCIQGYKRPSLIVCNPLIEEVRRSVVKILPSRNYKVGLMHMRVDDAGNFKLLIAGSSYTDNDTQHQLSHYTEEYDSKTDSWEQQINPDLSASFKVDTFQNGAYYKDSHDQELLLCISTIDAMDSKGVLMYDLKKKSWRRCRVPQVTAEGSDTQPVDPISIEDYGRIIFLFSEQKCGDHVYIFIHKLNLDAVGNVTWEEVIRKKRIGGGQYFYVYPSTICVPSNDEITGTGGCIFVFSMDNCGECLRIHEWDPRGDTLWGHRMSLQTPQQSVLRGSNWTDDEKHGSLLLNLEALQYSLVKGPPWKYISQGLWEWGGFDRCPKSCQGQWDTLTKTYKKVLKQSKSNGSVNFEFGLNQRSYNLIEAILALKAKNRVSLAPKAPGRGQKRVRSAEFLDSANSVQLAAGSGGPSSSATGILASTVLQPSATGGPSSSPSTATATPPSAGAGPSQPTVPIPGSSNADIEPFYTIPRPAAPTNPSDNLDKSFVHGRTLDKSAQRLSDYQRAMNVLQGNGQELTATEKGELFKKTVHLDLLKEQHRNKFSLNTGEPASKFNEVIDFLKLQPGSGFSSGDCFELLMGSLETDILRHG